MAQMDDDVLRSVISAGINECSGSMGGNSSQLASERALALSYYFGRPFGNEVDYRSSVVITEVADTIGWILPSLLKVFTTNEDIVRFDATTRADEEACEEETNVVNNIFYKQNNGFLILYSFFWSALVLKNGYVKTYWEDNVKTTRETYKGLDANAFEVLLSDQEITPISYSETTQTIPGPDGQPIQATYHDITVERKCPYGKCKLEVIPPEEMYISPRCRGLDLSESPLVAQISRKTKSDLLEMGISKDKLEGLSSYASDAFNQVGLARDIYSEELANHVAASSLDETMSEYYIAEAYLRVDYDGDGIAELMKVTLSGNAILDKEEVDCIPFSSVCPVIIPHRHHGQSIADLVMDLQRIESEIARNMMDNFYFVNNQRVIVGPGVVLDDLLTTRPGGIVRTIGVPGQDVVPMPVAQLGETGLAMLDWLESVREKRTGVSKNSQGLNDDVVGDTAHGTERLMSAAEQKIDCIAKIFAETGMKDIFLKIHALIRKHGYATEIKLKTGWKNIDPTEWVERNSMSVKVGLGAGERTKTQGAISRIMEIQNALATTSQPGVLVNVQNQYNAAVDFARSSGLPNPDSYFTDPQSPEAQQILSTPPPEDPNATFMKEQIRIEQLKAQLKGQETKTTAAIEEQKQQAHYAAKIDGIEQKYAEMQVKHKEFLAELEFQYAKLAKESQQKQETKSSE